MHQCTGDLCEKMIIVFVSQIADELMLETEPDKDSIFE